VAELNAAFWRWFGNSVVRNADGTPEVLYHGTHTGPGKFRRVYGMAGHFGTMEAAQQKIEHDIEDGGRRGKTEIMPVYLRICNPVAMTDVHFDEYATMAEDLVERGILDEGVLPVPWKDRYGPGVRRRADNAAAIRALIDVLERYGYDGIEYENRIEDPGSNSYIPFHPEQVKSAHNDGTWDADDPSIASNPGESPKVDVLYEYHIEGDVAVLDYLEVPPRHRRRGYGTQAYRKWERGLPESIRHVVVYAEDLEGTGRPVGFYESLGFRSLYPEAADDDRWFMIKERR